MLTALLRKLFGPPPEVASSTQVQNQGAGQNFGQQTNIFGDQIIHGSKRFVSNVRPLTNDVYVPRPTELDQLATALHSHSGVAVTSAQAVGEGGYGKTWLARAYAFAHVARYPGGIFELICDRNQSPESLFATLHGPDASLTQEERAHAVYEHLSGEARCLLILDNIEDPDHYAEFEASRFFPKINCHVVVTTRSFGLSDLPKIQVGRLTDAEAAALLAKYVPASAERPDLVAQIIREAEGMAVLVAAVGARLQRGTVADLEKYVQWLSTFEVEPSTDLKWAHYPPKFGAIVHDLYARLHPASLRALEYAALLPPDLVNPEDLIAVLVADQTDPDLGWEEQIPGVPVSVDTYLAPLREREILTGPESGPWSLHRLHRRALIARLSDEQLIGRVQRLVAQASAHFDLCKNLITNYEITPSIVRYGHAITILTGIREVLQARRHWTPSLQRKLASASLNRGIAYAHAQDLAPAIADFDVAITILTGIREAQSPLGEWTAAVQNDLGAAYLNRGNTNRIAHYISAAIADYDKAISIFTEVRETFVPGSEWPLSYQSDLAGAYMNRGVAHRLGQDLNASIADFDIAIRMMNAIRDAPSLVDEWSPTHQNDLALAHMNRASAYFVAQDIAVAVTDYGVAISLMTAIRKALRPCGQWSPYLQVDMAGAHMNRGNAYLASNALSSAIGDYGIAIEILHGLRDELLVRSDTSSTLQNDLANAYVSRGTAHVEAMDLSSAITDYGEAITIMEAIRDNLSPVGRWSATLQNCLANALMNRGNAHTRSHNLTSAISDLSYAITIRTGIREALHLDGHWSVPLQKDLAITHMNRGNAYAASQEFPKAISDYEVATEILHVLADAHPEFAVEYHLLLANWFLLGVVLDANIVRVTLTNLQRLRTRFDAPTLARLQIPQYNRQIADGLPKVTPALSPTELTAARAALLDAA